MKRGKIETLTHGIKVLVPVVFIGIGLMLFLNCFDAAKFFLDTGYSSQLTIEGIVGLGTMLVLGFFLTSIGVVVLYKLRHEPIPAQSEMNIPKGEHEIKEDREAETETEKSDRDDSDKLFCSSCGEKIKEGWTFCKHCGIGL